MIYDSLYLFGTIRLDLINDPKAAGMVASIIHFNRF